MYNIHTQKVHVPYEKQQNIQNYKENESLYYYLPLIPSLPVPTRTPNWHAHAQTHTHAHMNMKQVDTLHRKEEKMQPFLGQVRDNP